MLVVEVLIDVAGPAPAVFEILADSAQAPRWLSGVAVTRTGFEVNCLGQLLEIRAQIRRHTDQRRVSVEVAIPFPILVQVAALPYGAGCRVILKVEAEPGDRFGLPDRVLSRIASRRFAADLVALREQLEAGAVVSLARVGAEVNDPPAGSIHSEVS